ncbi:helix-turn-helix transcriptional regulator [Acholeplasma equirhinis]|uniref:helix-turn-helix domain-containing protein n=1 Tax=Acholeplasma equirhinis TaxID=555393 RepID=UPI00197ACD29|nr:helix-turn-helix transcriptional regulator [Acholeplasma equirhinis]MBN3490164.1 helix-turn-helix transcriptional regulator [Acholeplasma equirhinis]
MLKLREFRLIKGLTQTKLAEMLGISQQAIAAYENGVRKLDQDLIIKFCLVLEVSPDDLLGYKDAYSKYTKYLMSLEENDKVK